MSAPSYAGTSSKPRPLVILDANVVIADRRLRSPSTSALCAAVERGEVDLAIPDVALHEVLRNYRRALKDVARQARELADAMRRLGITPQPHLDVDVAYDQYEAWLRGHLAHHTISILRIPEAQHGTLLEWDLAVRKPFKQDGSGYRDALIWCSVLDECRARQVLLVSNDRGFARNRKAPDELADELYQDLDERVGSVESVRLFPKVGDLIEHLSGREVDVMDALNSAFATGTALRDRLLADVKDKLLQTDTARLSVEGVSGDIVEIVQEMIHEPVVIQAERATTVTDGRYLIDLYVEADIDLAVTWQSDRWDDSDRFDLGATWPRPGSRYESTGTSATLYYSAEATYDRSAGRFTDVNVAEFAGGTVRVRP